MSCIYNDAGALYKKEMSQIQLVQSCLVIVKWCLKQQRLQWQ